MRMRDNARLVKEIQEYLCKMCDAVGDRQSREYRPLKARL
jgi:hypothetical protein